MKRHSHSLVSLIGRACLWLSLSTFCLSISAHSQSPFIDAPQDGITEDYTASDSEAFNVIPDSAKKLGADGLHTAFSGVSHRGQYRFLREATGTFAFTETTKKDGTLVHVQGHETLKGIWNVQGDQICYTYERIWTYPVCFNIYKSGTCYYHLLRSSDGIARQAVTARSTPTTQTPDCDALSS